MEIVTDPNEIEQKPKFSEDIFQEEIEYSKNAEHGARPRERKDFGMQTISLIGSIGGTLSAVESFFAMPLAISMILLPLVLMWLGFSLHQTLRSVLRI